VSTPNGTNAHLDALLQYEQLVASIDGIVWEADAKTFQFTFVSKQAERLVGYPFGEWLEPGFWADHLHPDDRQWAVAFCQKATAEKRLHDFEYRMIAADGRTVWLRDIVTVVCERGEPQKLRGIMVDVTEKKRVEQERQEHVRFLESLNRVNRAIQGATDLEQMVRDVLDVVLDIYDCDRAWLIYPCDPDATILRCVMERTRPEFPGAVAAGGTFPVEGDQRSAARAMLAADEPVTFAPDGDFPVPPVARDLYGVRTGLAIAVRPKEDTPYTFGVHQCSRHREWAPQERRLFREIGRRLADALTTLLMYRRMRDSEARFRVFVDHATDAFFLHDATGVILDVNRQACASLGYTREELIGQTPSVFDTGLDRMDLERVAARRNSGEVFMFDTRHRRKDGTVFPVEVRIRPFWEGGKPYGVSLARDMTDRKRAESALAAREAELRNLAESSPGLMGTFYIRPDGTACVPYASPRIWDLFALRPEEVRDSAEALLARTHPDDDTRVRESIAESGRTMAPWWLEYRVVHPARGELWLESNLSPEPHPEGGIIWYGFIHDVTDRKRAEEALRQTERQLRTLIESYPDFIARFDAGGRHLYASPMVTRSFGVPLDRLLGRTLSEIGIVGPPGQNAALTDAIRRAFEQGLPNTLEAAWPTPQGERVFEARHVPERDASGRVVSVLGITRDVTDRTRAVEALRESEHRLEAAQRMAHVAWWERNFETGRATRSRESYRIFGLPPEEWDDLPTWDRRWRACLHPDDRERATAALRRALEGGPRYDLEYRVVWPTGAVRVVHSQGDVTFGADGRPLRMFGTMQDVTELRHAERELRASEARFRTFVDHAADAFFLMDDRAVVLDVNRQACESLGCAREELIGKRPLDFDPAVGPAALDQLLARLDAGEVLAFDTQHRRKDGTVFPVEIRIRPFWEGDKRYAVALVRDVTDRKRAERALAESHGLLNAVVEGTPDAVFVKDLSGRYLLINSAGARFLGRTAAAVIGKGDRELFTADTAEQVLEGDRTVLASGQTHTFEETLTAAGVTRTYQTSKGVFRDPHGHVVGLVGISRDVTELKRLEEQFRQAQKMEAVGRLAGGVAHDFNNLLTVISGFTELLLSGVPAADPRWGAIKAIQEAGERATALTRQLLAFSRQTVLQLKVVGLNDVVRETETLLRRLIGEDILLTTVLDPRAARVRVDPGQFGQVLMNLAVNARDAMPTGGQLTIETRNADLGGPAAGPPDARPGRYVALAVSDTGSGMTPEVKARIFEPFFTTKGPSKGTGLGLATVYGIIKQSGGYVEVYSEVGYGTTFKLYFPVADEPVPAPGRSGPPAQVRPGSETVLLVEDEDAVRGLALLVLQTYGYKVLAAADGPDALRVLERHAGPIDLLVTDVVMPGMSGRELADALRARRPEQKVLFVSGYTDDAVVRHGLLQAEVSFLQKPYTPLTLAKKIRDVLDGTDR